MLTVTWLQKKSNKKTVEAQVYHCCLVLEVCPCFDCVNVSFLQSLCCCHQFDHFQSLLYLFFSYHGYIQISFPSSVFKGPKTGLELSLRHHFYNF